MNAEIDKVSIRSNESRIEFAMAGVFTLILAGTLFYVHSLFRPIAPPTTLTVWTTIMAITIIIMGAVPLIFMIRRPSDVETVQFWSPLGKVVAILYDAAIALSIWTLLPYASEELRLLMVIFYISAICGQVISTAESLWTNGFGIVIILGSIAGFYLQSPGPYSIGIAIFCLSFGILLFAVAMILKNAIRGAIAARLAAESSASELASALDLAREERDRKARFIAAASHDLRQPLYAASLYLEQMLETQEDASRQHAAEGIRGCFKSTNQLLDSILDHLRLQSGKVQLRREPVYLLDLFENLARLHAREAEQVRLTIEIDSGDHCCHADRKLIERVLSNLIVNAIRHSGAEVLVLSSRLVSDAMEITVRDDGSGIDSAEALHIFEEFKQGHGQKLNPDGGMGLGLSSARQIVRMHGHDLVLEPSQTGACFRFLLPISPGHVQPISESTVPRRIPETAQLRFPDGFRMLLVEDNDTLRQTQADLYRRRGATVVDVASVAQAKAALSDGPWSVVISDWRLSLNETGGDVATQAQQLCPETPVIVLTGDGAPNTLNDIRARAEYVLFKPVSVDRVVQLCTTISAGGKK